MLTGILQRSAAPVSHFYVICKGKKRKSGSKDNGQAARIIDTSQYTLKQQLRFVKAVKAYTEGGKGFGAPAQRSAFRRKRVEEETQDDQHARAERREGEAEEIARQDALLGMGKGLRSIYRTKGIEKPPAVLVDGYNCLLWWLCQPGDKEQKDRARADLEGGRLEFERNLSEFSSWRGVRVMVAWDAQGNVDSPGLARSQESGVEKVFVGDTEADSFIIQEAQQLRASGCPHVLVASNDQDIADTCNSNEIYSVSADYLLKEIKRAQKEAKAWSDERAARFKQSEKLGAALFRRNPALYEKMEKARLKGLKEW